MYDYLANGCGKDVKRKTHVAYVTSPHNISSPILHSQCGCCVFCQDLQSHSLGTSDQDACVFTPKCVSSRLCLCISYASRAAKSCSLQSALTQKLTKLKFYLLNWSILEMKNYIKNVQTTFVDIHARIRTGPENRQMHYEKIDH